jgi:hypothetical protein
MHTRRNLIAVALCSALLASCGPPPMTPNYPDIRFNQTQPFTLNARQIEIRTLYIPTDTDRAYPVPPVQALQNWGRDRLRANGSGTPARFTIGKATALIRDLPIQDGFKANFTDQVSQQYDVAVDATIEILDDHGLAARTVHVTANRSRTALQSATPVQREQIRYEMVRDLMADFDRQAETQLRNNFGTYLLSR